MKTIQELQDELSHAVRSAEDITVACEKRNDIPNAGEQKAIDEHLARAKEIRDEIEHLKKGEERIAAVKKAREELNTPEARKTSPANPQSEPSTSRANIEIPGYAARYGKMKAFRSKNAEADAYKAGMVLAASLHGNYKAIRWCQQNGIELRAMGESNNASAGFLVPEEMSQAIIDLREEYGVFRRNTRVRPMASDTLIVPRRTGGLTATFVGESTAGTASDKTFDQVQLVAKKLYALTYVSSELAEDAIINVADDLAQEMAYAFALKEDQCGFTGDGSSTYGGITGVNTKILGLAGAVDGASGHDTFAEIDATDLANVMGKLPQYARMGAKWYCSAAAFDIIFSRLAVGAGGNTIQTVAGAVQRSYLGYPIEISQVMPTTTGDLSDVVMILFGDLAMASSMGERRGIKVARSDEIKFIEDQIAIKATERVDINVHDVGDASTPGAIVALIGE
jgi:HK97 family phage major capsid protein